MNEIEEIEAAETASDTAPADASFSDHMPSFVREHPGLTLAGGVALGVLAAALIPKRSRNRITTRSRELVDIATAAGLALGKQAWDKAETAGSDLRRHGERAAERASELGGEAGKRVKAKLTPAEEATTRAAEMLLQKATDFVGRMRK